MRTVQRVFVGPIDTSSAIMRRTQTNQNNQLVLACNKKNFFSSFFFWLNWLFWQVGHNDNTWTSKYTTTWSALTAALPPNVHLLTFKTTSNNEILLRLQHLFAVNEDDKLSKPVSVDISKIFVHLSPVSITEMSLTNNQPKSEMHRMSWETVGSDKEPARNVTSVKTANPFVIELKALEIRTFVVRFQNTRWTNCLECPFIQSYDVTNNISNNILDRKQRK